MRSIFNHLHESDKYYILLQFKGLMKILTYKKKIRLLGLELELKPKYPSKYLLLF